MRDPMFAQRLEVFRLRPRLVAQFDSVVPALRNCAEELIQCGHEITATLQVRLMKCGELENAALFFRDGVPPASEIVAHIGMANGHITESTSVTMHDGSVVKFRALPEGYDPTDRQKVYNYLQERQGKGEVPTGLLYLDESVGDVHEMNNTPDEALISLPYDKLCPGNAELQKLLDEFR